MKYVLFWVGFWIQMFGTGLIFKTFNPIWIMCAGTCLVLSAGTAAIVFGDKK